MLNGVAKYYLYAESMMDEDGVPVQAPLKSYEKEGVYQAAQACVGEIPPWMQPKIEDYGDGEDWACISLSMNGKDVFLELCNIDFKDLVDV